MRDDLNSATTTTGETARKPVDRRRPTERWGIGFRLLTRILVFSSLVTLTLTAAQLYLDFHREVGGVDERIREIGRSAALGLGDMLWKMDEDQIRLQLEGIVRLPNIGMAQVREETGGGGALVVTVGRDPDHPLPPTARAVEFPLVREFQGVTRPMGTLRVEADLREVYDQLIARGFVILATQGIKTFVMSAFILFIVHRLITRHLTGLAERMRRATPGTDPPRLALSRPATGPPDELDQLVDSFNDLSERLTAANRELMSANAALERDVAIRQAYEEQLYRQAHSDDLTGLANRVLVRDRLDQAIATSVRDGVPCALLSMDLDHFKNVNDTLGHDAGDALLRAVAERLSRCVASGDTLARMGGDEFVIILPRVPNDGVVRQVADAIARRLAAPFTIDGVEHFVTASVGIALHPADGADEAELRRSAELALYRAKEGGRNRYQFFTAEINDRMWRRMSLENRLRGAVKRREFVLHHQPIFAADTGALIAFEALVRWCGPSGRLIPPGDFIGVAEEVGLIEDIGAWVLETAVHATATTFNIPDRHPRLAVNVSPRQLRATDFATMVRRVLDDHRLAPDRLELEITESVVMDDTTEVKANLGALRGMGVRLSIDDFGTGYSSLGYLHRHHFDTLKIDRSFVMNLGRDPGADRLVETIITMAHGLGLETVAEGVETGEQREFLRARRCDALQGYLLGRPVPAREAREILRGEPTSLGTPA